jgi:glycosyltransferase involved in cell wall biosynthesis
MKDKARVLLIGGLPGPSGGVTVFLGRLVNLIGDKVDFHVLDIHQGQKEQTHAKSHKIAPQTRLLKSLWLIWKICAFSGDIVHFNYSGCHALVALVFLPKFGRKFFLTLHNGSQMSIYNHLGWLAKWCVHRGALKVDRAFSLCDDHNTLYETLELESERVVHAKSQIPPPRVTPGMVDERHRQLRATNKHVVVSSGHVSRSYNYEFLIQFVNETPDTAGLLFFYGEHQDTIYLEELKALIQEPSRICIYFHQSESTFLSAIAASDAYLRPTYVDSWGIAVADAIAMGVPAIASDVCQRAQGAILCKPNDFITFTKLVKNNYSESSLTKQLPKINSHGNTFLKEYTVIEN